MKRSLLSFGDLTRKDVEKILDYAFEMKKLYRLGIKKINYLSGKFFVLLFEKPSTRTRISFEVAIKQLGGDSTFISAGETQLSRGEPLKDFARVVSRYADGLIARVKRHEDLEELDRHSTIPVINALSDREHPVQALADLMTIKERLGRLTGVRIAFIGDGRDNVLNSLMLAAALVGAHIHVASPPSLKPLPAYVERASRLAEESGGGVQITTDPFEAVREADVVYTDVWVSMGQEGEAEWRREVLRPYQVNRELLSKSSKQPIVMHCLPAVRGEEITEDVLESEQSVVFDQAENRLHVQKGLLYYLFKEA